MSSRGYPTRVAEGSQRKPSATTDWFGSSPDAGEQTEDLRSYGIIDSPTADPHRAIRFAISPTDPRRAPASGRWLRRQATGKKRCRLRQIPSLDLPQHRI